MRTKILTFISLLFVLSIANSCYDDKSELDSFKIDEIVIESNEMPEILRVDYYGKVNFAPTVKMGAKVNPTDISYKWEINLTPGENNFVELGNERVLDATITNQILSASYTLILTVRDELHGLDYQRSWPLYVSSPFREGIVVADTKDGQTSDLNLIMDNPITTSYDKGEDIFYNIWEQTLGKKHPSLIKSVDYTLHKPSPILTKNVITTIFENKDVQMTDCEDYSLYRNVDQIFPGRDVNFNPQAFSTINNQYWMFTVNGMPHLSPNNQGVTSMFTPVSMVETANNAVAIADNSSGSGPYAFWYNSDTGGIYNVAMTLTTPAMGGPYTNEGVFNPQAIPNRTVIAGDVSMDGITATMLMKDNDTNNYELYAVSFSYTDADWNQTPSAPKLKVNLPTELNSIIDNAVSVFFNMFDPVMFVATKSKVYAVNFGGGVVSHREVYTATEGEIAKGKLFVQGRFRLNQKDFNEEKGPIFEKPLDLNTKAIVLAINQGSNNGIIEVIPQENTSTGILNPSEKLKYDGFGKILDFTFQGQ